MGVLRDPGYCFWFQEYVFTSAGLVRENADDTEQRQRKVLTNKV